MTCNADNLVMALIDVDPDFTFLNPKIQVEASMLTPAMLTSKTYHLICTPPRCMKLVTDILARRKEIMKEQPELRAADIAPIFVWEPMEGSCRPDELPSFYKALKFVDVFSPNEHELSLLCNGARSDENSMAPEILYQFCNQLLTLGPGDESRAVVVRRGAAGCVVASHDRFVSLPAYHRPPPDGSAEEVAAWHADKTRTWDVTGGGNAFLGGVCIGLLSSANDQVVESGLAPLELAAIYGSVAASFAIEQVGMPKLNRRQADGTELWNGDGK